MFCANQIGKVLLNPLVLWPEFNTSYLLEGIFSCMNWESIVHNYNDILCIMLTFLNVIDICDGTELNRDVQHFVSLWEAWDLLTGNRTMETFDFTVYMDTEIDKGINVTGTAHLTWPGLADHSSQALQFPLTLVGNTSVSGLLCDGTLESFSMLAQNICLSIFDIHVQCSYTRDS